MKNPVKLQQSYASQKVIFDEARERRILNRTKEIEKIDKKISELQAHKAKLQTANQNEKEFESFDSFRLRSEQQAAKQSSEA